jgi:hypothetical protein
MSPRTFVLLHLGATFLGISALWWFAMPDRPAEAVADGITAGAVAGYVEILAMRLL